MSEIFNIIFYPFAWLLRSLYFLFNSYGMAIIVFCLITKIILFPLSLKGKKSMVKMNSLSSKQQQLQKQYGKDKVRLNAEVQKLYEKENVNPMGGCMWSLLPLPILIGLYGVIRQPLHYMMNLTSDEVNQLSSHLFGSVISAAGTGEITIAEELFHRFQEVVAALPALADKLFSLDFTFLGINLAAIPQWNPTQFTLSWNNIGLFLIPFFSAGLAFVSMRVSMKTNSTGNNKDNPMANNKTMILMMPAISLWIGFTLPAALGIYWIANNVFTMLQELLAGKLLKKDYAAAAIRQEERDRLEKEEEKEKKRLAAEVKTKALAEGKKRPVERKTSGDVLANSRSGMRAYARGRAYDPNRYGVITSYHDPATPVDESALEAALSAKEAQMLETPQEDTEEIDLNSTAADQADHVEVLEETAEQTPAIAPALDEVTTSAEKELSDVEDYEPEAAEYEEDEEK